MTALPAERDVEVEAKGNIRGQASSADVASSNAVRLQTENGDSCDEIAPDRRLLGPGGFDTSGI